MYNVRMPGMREKKRYASGERASCVKEKNNLRRFQMAVWTFGVLI